MDTRITQEFIKSKLRYWPITGNFTRVGKRGNWRTKFYADSVNGAGYKTVCLLNKNFLSHRLAWIYMHGSIPEGMEIDHINGDKSDNMASNLRLATRLQNGKNVPKRNGKAGLRGVVEVGSRYMAQIGINRGTKYLGLYDTADQAHAAYVAASNELFGNFARTS